MQTLEKSASIKQPIVTGRVLVVDDNVSSLQLLKRMLERDGHVVTAVGDSREVVALTVETQPDVVLLDVIMPEPDGFELCRALKQHHLTLLTPVVLVTALDAGEDRLRGIEAGADDFLTKPIEAAELRARVRSLVRLKRYTDELESAESVILSLGLTIEARAAGTEGHCQRLATYATALGSALGLRPEALHALRRGGFLHDVGKIGIPDRILLKPGRLTPEEYTVMQQHTVIGERLCGQLRSLKDVRPIARHHHERLDGSGYPDGLAGDEIPLLAQVISVVDVFDALRMARSYRTALSDADALAVLRTEAAAGWKRRDLVEAFEGIVRAPHFNDLLMAGPIV